MLCFREPRLYRPGNMNSCIPSLFVSSHCMDAVYVGLRSPPPPPWRPGFLLYKYNTDMNCLDVIVDFVKGRLCILIFDCMAAPGHIIYVVWLGIVYYYRGIVKWRLCLHCRYRELCILLLTKSGSL